MKATGITTTVILSLMMGVAVSAHARQEQRDDHPEAPKQQEAPHEKQAPPAHEQQAHPQQQARPERQAHPQPQAHAPQPHAQPHAAPQPHQQPQHAEHQPAQHAQQPHAAHPTAQHAQQPHATHPAQHAQQPHATHPAHPPAQHGQPAAHRQTGVHRTPPRPVNHTAQQAAWQQHRTQNWQSEHRTWAQRGGYHGYRVPDARFRTYFGEGHRFRIYGLPFETVSGYPRFQYHGYWVQMLDPWPYNWASDWYDTDPVYIQWMDGGYYLIDPRYPDYPLAVEIIQ